MVLIFSFWEDEKIARKMYELLRKNSIEAKVLYADMLREPEGLAEAEKAIRSCDLFMPIISSDSFPRPDGHNDKEMIRLLRLAMDRNRVILLFLIKYGNRFTTDENSVFFYNPVTKEYTSFDEEAFVILVKMLEGVPKMAETARENGYEMLRRLLKNCRSAEIKKALRKALPRVLLLTLLLGLAAFLIFRFAV